MTTLYTFKGRADGANPNGDLIGKDGVIYGTAVHGGALDGLCTEYGYGCGVVLSLNNGKEHVQHRFKATPDGAWPDAGLVSYGTGFIGTTSGGGGCSYMRLGCGALFSISTSGAERVLHDFKGAPSSDGSSPGPLTTIGTKNFRNNRTRRQRAMRSIQRGMRDDL
jgi:hypothetical protein